jgi:hypothetical protein
MADQIGGGTSPGTAHAAVRSCFKGVVFELPGVLGVLLLSSSIACVPEAPLLEPGSGPEAMLEIQEAADLFELAFLEGNPEALVGLMTVDAVASLIGGPAIVGEEALRRFFLMEPLSTLRAGTRLCATAVLTGSGAFID